MSLSRFSSQACFNRIPARSLRIRLLLSLMMPLAILLSWGAPAKAETPQPPLDMSEAREICDRGPLQSPEGIWTFPGENMNVMVMRLEDKSGNHTLPRYRITVLETPDVRFSPGDTIGWIDASTDERKFRMELFTRRSATRLLQPAQLLAEMSADGGSINVKAEKLRIKISRLSFLPNFWRMLKLQYEDPLRQLPVGLVKIYPLPAQSPAMKRGVRYL